MLLGTGSIALAAKHGHKSKHHGGTLSISKQTWGSAHGQAVDLYTLRNSKGMIVKITNYGGVVQSIWVPDRTGQLKNVALGFPKLSDYVNDFENQPWPAAGGSGETYFGGIIGRYANRIADASFTLNGTLYGLGGGPNSCGSAAHPNNGPNLLHGGPLSYNTQVWAATPKKLSNGVELQLSYTDPNCYNGFPGTVTTVVTYTLTNDNALRDRLPGDHERADRHQLHQPHVLQPRRRRLRQHLQPEARDQLEHVPADRQRADPDRVRVGLRSRRSISGR